MEFDIKGRIRYFAEQLRYSVAGLAENDDLTQIRFELGDEGYSKLYDIVYSGNKISEQDFDEIKQSYFKAQQEKVVVPTMWNDNYFFEYYSDDEFKDMIKYQLEENMIDSTIAIDEIMLNLLRGATSEKYLDTKTEKEVKIKGTKLEDRQKDLKRMIERYIKQGYNPYPLMRKINAEYERLAKEENEVDKESQSKLICAKSQMLMERTEALSPYKPIFNMAEKLGELMEEEKQMMKDENYDNMDELQEKIDKQKELLTKRIESSGFDLDELASVINGKKDYIKECEHGFNYQSPNYAMFVGLQESNRRIQSIKLRQDKQNQL
ncbi:MAG: hypothetical protein ACLRFE_01110 [Clostridia bacterium]